jgi:uncharacterized protein YgiM (DUF1202 family)
LTALSPKCFLQDSKSSTWITLATFIVLSFSLLCSPLVLAKKKGVIKVIVTTTFIDMHTGPGRGYPKFHVIEKDEEITLLFSKTDWIKAETQKGIKGWIHRRDMENTVGINNEIIELGIPKRGDFTNRRWEIGASFGEFEDIESLGINAAYRLTENLSFELRASQATGRFSNSKFYSWGIVHQPFPKWRLSPFFTLANGQVEVSPNTNLSQIQDREDSYFLVGTGASFYLSHRFFIRLEYNSYTSLPERDENENNEEWKLGVSAFF